MSKRQIAPTRRNFTEDRRTCEAATPGPWIVLPETCGPDGQAVYEADSGGIVCEVGDPYPRGNNRPSENMRFIAEARTGWPAALDEIERLRDVLQRIADCGSLTGEDARDMQSIAEGAL